MIRAALLVLALATLVGCSSTCRVSNEVHIRRGDLPVSTFGHCQWWCDGSKPTEITIGTRHDEQPINLTITIAHEMWHAAGGFGHHPPGTSYTCGYLFSGSLAIPACPIELAAMADVKPKRITVHSPELRGPTALAAHMWNVTVGREIWTVNP